MIKLIPPMVAALIHPVYLVVAALMVVGVIPVTHVSVGIMLLIIGFVLLEKTRNWQKRFYE